MPQDHRHPRRRPLRIEQVEGPYLRRRTLLGVPPGEPREGRPVAIAEGRTQHGLERSAEVDDDPPYRRSIALRNGVLLRALGGRAQQRAAKQPRVVTHDPRWRASAAREALREAEVRHVLPVSRSLTHLRHHGMTVRSKPRHSKKELRSYSSSNVTGSLK